MNDWDKVAAYVDFNLEFLNESFFELVPKNAKILDFGCGYGRVSNQLSQGGYFNIIGIDSSLAMIERGLKQFPELDLRYCDSSVLPFPSNYFDSVILCAVLTCISKFEIRQNIINEIYRVLKPKGIVYLSEFTAEQSIKFVSKNGTAMWHSNQSELLNLLEQFEILSVKPFETQTLTGTKSLACQIVAKK